MSYDLIASTYYDPRRPTIANFDLATRHGLRELQPELPQTGRVLELGAGKGRLGEYCGIDAGRIVQCDLSIGMLRLQPREQAAFRVRCDAARLPFASGSFQFVAAFLCDCYNTPAFYENAFRVLAPGGMLLATLPHIEWGAAFRGAQGDEEQKAVFPMPDGGSVQVDSLLSSPEQLCERLVRAGFDTVLQKAFTLPRSAQRVSPHVALAAQTLGKDVHELSLIQFICGSKPPA